MLALPSAVVLLAVSSTAPALRPDALVDPDSCVAAELAVRSVYWAHMTWPAENPTPKPPFDRSNGRAAAQAKVADDRAKRAALRLRWQQEVSAPEIQGELERIARTTQRPGMLREVYEALNGDARLLARCFVEPLLLDWRLRQAFKADERIQTTVRDVVDRELASSRLTDSFRTRAGYREVTYVLDEGTAELTQPRDRSETRVDSLQWGKLLGALESDVRGVMPDASNRRAGPSSGVASIPTGLFGAVRTESTAFVARGVISLTADRMTVATMAWPKISFEEWWQENRPATVDRDSAAADGAFALPTGPSEQGDRPDDSWFGRMQIEPYARREHSAIWTGNKMIIWGGTPERDVTLGDGAAYDPLTDQWQDISSVGAPISRAGHATVWTGTEMIIWGGWRSTSGQDITLFDGARYDPRTDSWKLVSTVGAPASGGWIGAVWTGREMVVWYGLTGARQGARYDPATDTWSPMSFIDAPLPREEKFTAVWSGTEMIVWGGNGIGFGETGTGGRYNPMTDHWVQMSTEGAPLTNYGHSAVWTGTEMIIWRGSLGGALHPNAAYDPVTDRWRGISGPRIPGDERRESSAVWTGTEMIVWGGRWGVGHSAADGARYNPVTNRWQRLSENGAPPERAHHSAIWTGEEMIVWGGQEENFDTAPLASTGGRYDARSDSWRPTRTSSPPPAATGGQSTLWTGTEAIIFGGRDEFSADDPSFSGGASFDPLTLLWTKIPRWPGYGGVRDHAAVWTGREMIVWGGWEYGGPGATGASYDPLTKSWTWLPYDGSPSRRSRHSAVWTGTSMLIWGGAYYFETFLDDGAAFNPATQTWTPLPPSGLSPRADHTAVWTGSRMFVWGGVGPHGDLADGALYDPVAGNWQPISSSDALSARSRHTATLADSKIFIWGGTSSDPIGSQYDLKTNSWAPLPSEGAPDPTTWHSAVWTGQELIVWGGRDARFQKRNSGGRYEPASNTWMPTTRVAAPEPRLWHSAFWTGSTMFIWGGIWAPGSGYTAICTTVPWYADRDGDGYGDPSSIVNACRHPAGMVQVAGDCDDTNPAINGGALDVCDGRDNDCNGLVDDDREGVDTDHDTIRNACDNCRTIYNPNQRDHDKDRVGDRCDNCLAIPNGTQHDLDNDGDGDMCDVDDGVVLMAGIDPQRVSWQTDTHYRSFNLYRGSLMELLLGSPYVQAPGTNRYAARWCGLTLPAVEDDLRPVAGDAIYWLVAGVGRLGEEPLGDGDTVLRTNTNPCP